MQKWQPRGSSTETPRCPAFWQHDQSRNFECTVQVGIHEGRPNLDPRTWWKPFPQHKQYHDCCLWCGKTNEQHQTTQGLRTINIPCRLIKELAPELAPCLSSIFQESLNSGLLPKDWKQARIAPAFKKGSTCMPENYRPISLTCVCCKLLEHIVCSHIHKHLAAWAPPQETHALRYRWPDMDMDSSLPPRPHTMRSCWRNIFNLN